MALRCRVFGWGVLSLLLFPRLARTSGDLAVTYDAPSDCPGAQSFAAEVDRRRSARVGSSRALPDGAEIVITKAAPPAAYHGRLRLDGGLREVDGATCVEVVEALALIVAVAEEELEAAPPAQPPTPAPAPVPVGASMVEGPGPAPRAESGARAVAGVALGVTTAAAPEASPLVEVFGGIGWRGASVRLVAAASRSFEITTPGGTARFERWTGRVVGCALTIELAALHLTPCLATEAGALIGSGLSMVNASSSALAWAAAAAGGRLEWDLSRHLFVEADARAILPLLRHRYVARPEVTAFAVPALAFEGSLGVGYRFSK